MERLENRVSALAQELDSEQVCSLTIDYIRPFRAMICQILKSKLQKLSALGSISKNSSSGEEARL